MAMRLTIIFHWMNWLASNLMMQQNQQCYCFVLGMHLQIAYLRMILVGHLVMVLLLVVMIHLLVLNAHTLRMHRKSIVSK